MPDKNRVINAPTVVVVLIGIFMVVHFVRLVLPERQALSMLLDLAFIPARYARNGEYLMALVIPGGPGAAYWSMITYAFVHGSLAHLAINSLWMLAFGSIVARRLSTGRFLILSALCVIAGAFAYLAFHWGEMIPVIGASAAISGQMGAAVTFMFSRPSGLFAAMRENPKRLPILGVMEILRTPNAVIFILIWVGLNILTGLFGGAWPGQSRTIAWEAHIAGFFTGMVLFRVFDRHKPRL